jgi:transmembrane sensor
MTDFTPSNPLLLMSPDPDWTLLGRYLSGDASADEAAEVERWVAVDPANARVLDFLRQVWVEAGTPQATVDEDAGWRVVQQNLTAAGTPVRPSRVTPLPLARPGRPWLRWGLAAAAVTLAATSVVWWQRGAGWARHQAEQAGREYTTARGQRAEVTLVDGTRAWLNAASRLRVPNTYGADTRDVELEGEAFFVVHHDAKRPFRVYARGAVSEDLGTELSVRSYPEDSAVVVLVASGKVAMGLVSASMRPDGKVALDSGQMGRLDRTGRMTVTDGVDLSGPLGWRDGRLEFDQRPLADVLRELGRWYDLDNVLDDSSLARVPLTFALDRHPADEALDIVAGVVGLRYVREGRQVQLFAQPPRH